MKLFFDNIIFKLQQAGGISTYWGELISRAIRDDLDINFLDYHSSNIVQSKLVLPAGSVINDQANFHWSERFKTVDIKTIDKSFLFHSSYNRLVKNKNAVPFCTVHDFIHEIFYQGPRKWVHSYQKRKAIEQATRIIVISENTKRDLLEFYPNISEKKVSVIYNGVSEDFFHIDGSYECYIEKPFVLYIGSREKYKNFTFTVEVLSELKSMDLVIVGNPLSAEETKHLNRLIPGNWKLLSKITNKELNILYNKAYALLYPSSYEGFGIPLLEAMKAGTPFLALNKSAIPEVAGNAGILLDKLDVSDFSDAIKSIEAKRNALIESGFRQADKFSWENCYQNTFNNYKSIL